MTDDEAKTRKDLAWSIQNTKLIIPEDARDASRWKWDANEAALFSPDMEWSFYVEIRRGFTRTRVGVLTVQDQTGRAEWQCDMPGEVAP